MRTRVAPAAPRPRGARAQPQLLGLQSRITRSQKTVDLAAKEYYPDFDFKFAYGQRDRAQDGSYRSDMILFTVAVNLPVWRSTKLAPMVAEAEAMRGQALDLYEAQRNEILMQLHHQTASPSRACASARLYESTILPQAKLAVESALAAYRVNRLDFLNVLDSQMTVLQLRDRPRHGGGGLQQGDSLKSICSRGHPPTPLRTRGCTHDAACRTETR